MKTEKLSNETKELLIGKKIIEVGDTFIILDNGCKIYLSNIEISNLN